jgi:hypothetical protein
VGLEEGCGEMQNGGGASLAGFACNPRRRVVERQREGKMDPTATAEVLSGKARA